MDEAFRLVLNFFEGDDIKARLWFESPNPQLGGISPNQMIACGRQERLLKFIRCSLAENEPPET